ncbi:MAG TPA: FlgD immunoglobulin-like domain containing protein [Candidatus Cloacimonadota bacterium]|nr:FlgD immunoglobulin-like domain containing protein [Candidatus Cloacimonadota bacterium]
MSIRSSLYTNSLVILALLLPLGKFFAVTAGDYRTKWGGSWENSQLWEVYNGNSWVNANSIPAQPITGTISVRHYLSTASRIDLRGSLIISAEFQLLGPSEMIINPGANLTLGTMRIASGAILANNGTLNCLGNSASLTIEAGGVFSNNSEVVSSSSRFMLSLLSSGTMNLGEHGSITGQGSFTAGYGSFINISHTQGLDGALRLSGIKNLSPAYYTFYGSIPQVTGESFPEQVLGIVFSNPAGTSLSNGVKAVYDVRVTTGSSLNTGTEIIDQAWYGSGHFIMEPNSTLITAHPQGISSTDKTGSIQLGSRDYSSSGNYTFNGQTVQTVGTFLTTPETSPDGRTLVNSITVDNTSGVTFSNPILVKDVVTVNDGTAIGNVAIDGDLSLIDGFDSSYYYHRIDPNGVKIRNYRPDTDTNNNQANAIRRRWSISGQLSGNKRITFYWDVADDNGIDWTSGVPSVRKGNQIYSSSEFDTHSNPRWISIILNSFDNRGNFTVIKNGDVTLPVQLSSFTATTLSFGSVHISWTTQSETAISGYYILRNTKDDLASAETVSGLIYAGNSSTATRYQFEDEDLQSCGTYYYWLQSIAMDGSIEYFGPERIVLESAPGSSPEIPFETGLADIFPNPFNPVLNVSYTLKQDGQIRISVYNTRGQLIQTLADTHKSRGKYSLQWDAKDSTGRECPSGTYLLVMQSGTERSVKRVSLVK